SKSPAGVKPAGRGKNPGLTFTILEAFARAGLTVFLAFAHARIARQVAMRFERRPQAGVGFEQCAGDAVTNSAGLAGWPAALHLDADIKFGARLSGDQRLHHD